MLKAVSAHQPWILGGLAVLWIGVLPWLCWGGWSNAHHPHINPHFVFAAPPLLDNDHHAHTHDPQDALAGVARPDTLLIALLALVLPWYRALLLPRQHHFPRHVAMPWSQGAPPPVPTPPPRAVWR